MSEFAYDYDDEAAGHADDFVNKVNENGPYEGVFTRVWAVTAKKGSKGVYFEFEASAGGKTNFTLWTIGPKGSERKDGTIREADEKFGDYNKLMAMMTILGLKGLRTKTGAIEQYDPEEKKRVETTGDTFPDLCNKKIGIVMQKELINASDGSGKEYTNMTFVGSFHPETRLTASEMREGVRKADPEKGKFAKMVRGLKTKDSRTVRTEEPAQPSQAAPEGSY